MQINIVEARVLKPTYTSRQKGERAERKRSSWISIREEYSAGSRFNLDILTEDTTFDLEFDVDDCVSCRTRDANAIDSGSSTASTRHPILIIRDP